ncbi:hypothetical protein BBBOND_0309380 [Babesia bigemina]|uniref:Uncharacterized protein n=1 Tax=Babesia bigemina TaxID=5866 RepID=A0A061DEC4_BABBI|nr:hypothetical protein BBBOND_0309380 [Babesia bigemina]CDR97035.1 hypothetical protein BBBOND_0309380 [Babesia bigemina]|eukprot:XP_012769221.1 hypothetical protein BBBOND_0309380 [Babesia bigemina]
MISHMSSEVTITPAVLPIIIVPASLIILVIRFMTIFRIRPFHKVRNFCAPKMNGLHSDH